MVAEEKITPSGDTEMGSVQGGGIETRGWLDSALLSAAGVPTAVIGPRNEGLHGIDEWVDLASVEACRAIISGTIAAFCR